ncbi:hypothetical protein DFH11DRAFT_1568843 [Phellopilus nigrolimitatus]|nr:hypothetical protein DFH11DRAFT_1568843 [Phellopilus nigrolimitatus]
MSNLKRTRDMVDSDDEEPTMGRQILPVARLPENFDGVPMDGMQYLFTVRRDSRKLPVYTRVANPYEAVKTETVDAPASSAGRVPLPSEEWRAVFLKRFKNFRKNSVQATIGVEFPAAPASASGRSKRMPEKKERDSWWAFINGRPECEWNPPKKSRKSKPERSRHARGMRSWDDGADELAQYEVSYMDYTEEPPAPEAFVVNEDGEVAEEPAGSTGQLLEEAVEFLPTPFATPQPEVRYRNPGSDPMCQKAQNDSGRPQQPTPALLKLMDSRYCTHLLMYFTHWITQHLEQLESPQPLPPAYTPLSQNHARWMFALLSRVDEQLSSDEMSNLRSLARACLALIRDLSKNQSRATEDSQPGMDSALSRSGSLGNWVGDAGDAPLDERACWIVVATIADFWGQKDLWMDAESTLSGS